MNYAPVGLSNGWRCKAGRVMTDMLDAVSVKLKTSTSYRDVTSPIVEHEEVKMTHKAESKGQELRMR